MLTSGTINTLKSKAREKKLTSICNVVAVSALNSHANLGLEHRT